MIHRKHKVSGHYCWDCRREVKAGVPNWPSGPSGSDYCFCEGHSIPQGFEVERAIYENLEEVIWTDGTRDVRNGDGGSEREDCEQCGNPNCKIPVHGEKYRAVVSKVASDWDKANPVVGSGSNDPDCRCGYAS